VAALRVVEEKSADKPDTLQTNLAVVDECGNKGFKIYKLSNRYNLN